VRSRRLFLLEEVCVRVAYWACVGFALWAAGTGAYVLRNRSPLWAGTGELMLLGGLPLVLLFLVFDVHDRLKMAAAEDDD